MQKFGNLDKWLVVEPNTAILFEHQRRVRLSLVAPVGTDLTVTYAHGRNEYFTTVSGSDVVEFEALEGMSLKASKPVRYYSAETEFVHIEETGAPSYAKVAQRKERNPEMERIAEIAARNVEKRMRYAMDEQARQHARELAEAKGQGNGNPNSAPATSGASGAPMAGEGKDDTATGEGLVDKSAAKPAAKGGTKGDDVSDGASPADE